MSQVSTQTSSRSGSFFWKRLLFSEAILSKTRAQKLAYIGVMTALCIAANLFFEFKMADVQFSLTLFFSMLSGVLIGPLFGFTAAFLGDLLGFVYNSWGYVYMPWIGLSCAAAALIAGLIVNLPVHFKGSVYVKLAAVCLLSLVVCTVGISTTGLYFYYRGVGFSAKVTEYLAERFGAGVTYWAYAFYRLFIGGQIYNCLFNYALLFASVPLLRAAKPLKLRLE